MKAAENRNIPKVSIITVVYNAVSKIESTILSVLNQNYGNVEYIVIDGGSTDGTVDIINRYGDDIDVFISEQDDGIYDAMNKGVRFANGEWVGIMNAGDVFVNNNTLQQIFLDSGTCFNCDVIYGDAISVDVGKEFYCRSEDSIDAMLRGPAYRQGASFVRRATHRKYLFDLSKKPILDFALDYEQAFRMYKGGCIFRKISLPVMKYELRGVSTVSPFKATYYNYIIPHEMKCSGAKKLVLAWLTLWRGGLAVLKRHLSRRSCICQ